MVPIAVIGLVDDIEVETGGPCVLLPQQGRVGGAGKGGIRHRQVNLDVLHPGLLQEALDLLRVIGVSRLRIDGELHGGRDRIVVADGAVTQEHLLDDLLAVERMLECQADIKIVEGWLGHVHHIDIVVVAGGLRDHQIRVLPQEIEGFQVGAIHIVDFAGVERVGARRHVVDRERFDRIEPGPVGFEIVRVAGEGRDYARVELAEHIGPGAVARLPVDRAVLYRHDRQIVVAGKIGEIGIAAREFEHHRLRPLGFHAGDRLEQRFDIRFRTFAPMVLIGGDDIVCRHRFAVMECGTPAQLEHPLLGAVRRLEARGQIGHRIALGIDLGEAVRQGSPQDGAGAPGLHGVGDGAFAQAQAECAASLRLRARGPDEHRIRH